VFNDRPTNDAGIYIVSEVSEVAVFGTVTKNTGDAGTYSVAELSQSSSELSVVDDMILSVIEEIGGDSTANYSDTIGHSVVEASEVFVGEHLSDNFSYSVSESAEIAVFSGTQVKVWNGSEFITAPMRRWNGTEMVEIVIRKWAGDSWV
jgi:hypothetical protein